MERDGKQIKPTSLGTVVTDLMMEYFPDVVNEQFTAGMEKDLDKVEEGKTDWVKMVSDFYGDFSKDLQKAESATDGQRVAVPEEESDVICEKCGRRMVIKSGRYGKFLACPGYPECRNTKRIVVQTPGSCPKCGSPMERKKSAKGRIYYACTGGRACGFMTWNEPTSSVCPKCGSTLFRKKGKNPLLVCEKEGCGYEEAGK